MEYYAAIKKEQFIDSPNKLDESHMHFPNLKKPDPPPLQKKAACFLFCFLIFYLFIYFFMAVLGLCFCARAFSSCGKWGPLFIAVRGPLTVVVSLVAEHRLQTRRLSNCGSRA